ncbi:quinone-dependent dihydroorotate dehydrogenase [Candidatus Binatia bacterium]|nr:quinone-dependent dihydroorotate dehydrogenase [Candidatus Binatia bacterium]
MYRLLRGALFRLDAERAHHLAIDAAALAEWMLEHGAGSLLHAPPAGEPVQLLGKTFANRIGLAAGFDKNGVAPHLWSHLGFGFAELGTITARAQPGNPRPRMFRLPAARAVVNRLGFNNLGAEEVARRLRKRLARRPRIPIGLNIGCSKVSVGDETAEREDYRTSTRLLAPLADYLAINVSSPNTPGLRNLHEPGRLCRLVDVVVREIDGLGLAAPVPVLVKLSPDLADDDIPAICAAARDGGAAGFIATNTTVSRPRVSGAAAAEAGGLSGPPLRPRATEVLRRVRAAVGDGVPLIGVGGVESPDDVREKLAAGADLVALYTALIYAGPLLPRRLAQAIARPAAGRISASVPTESASAGR